MGHQLRAARVKLRRNDDFMPQTISRLVKDGEAALRERVCARHREALRRLEQDRVAGVLAWATSLPDTAPG